MIHNEDEARAFVAERCSSDSFAKLQHFVGRLCEENARQNLVSGSSLDRVWTRHVADSAQLLDLAPSSPALWLDLGSGAGFPGLVIAIMRPDIPVRLVESRKLRVEWLNACLRHAGASNSAVIGLRLDAVSAAPASVISARAFAPLPRLLASAGRFSTSDTTWLLPKGRSAEQEVAQLPKQLRRMFHVEPSATDADSGIVVGRIEKDMHR